LYSFAIPRHSFFLWLAFRDSVSTGDRSWKWGAMGNVKCVFCRNMIEFRDHLFIECGLSKKIWREVMKKCTFKFLFSGWDEVVREGLKAWKGKSLFSIVCKLAWGATVYSIWKHRNIGKFGNRMSSEVQILQHICWEVSTRSITKGSLSLLKLMKRFVIIGVSL
jgi:hypothetical protein